MTIIDKIFGEKEGVYKSPSDNELQMEQTGTKERKPKAEISLQDEIDWINGYHAWVFKTLMPRLDDADAAFLEDAARPIG